MQGGPMEEVDGVGIEIEREGCQNPPAEYSDTDSDSWECCGICADLFHIGKFFCPWRWWESSTQSKFSQEFNLAT